MSISLAVCGVWCVLDMRLQPLCDAANASVCLATPPTCTAALPQEKLNYFWIVEKKKLEDKRAELRNKEREMQDLEEKHQVEIKVYKQRVKHLLYEHQDERTRQKLGAQVSLKIAQADSRTSEADLTSDKRLLKVELKEMQLAHDDFMTALKTVRCVECCA